MENVALDHLDLQCDQLLDSFDLLARLFMASGFLPEFERLQPESAASIRRNFGKESLDSRSFRGIESLLGSGVGIGRWVETFDSTSLLVAMPVVLKGLPQHEAGREAIGIDGRLGSRDLKR